jgi:hypothetical protein
MENKYLIELESRITELSALAIEDMEKKLLVRNLYSRYTSELEVTLNKDEIKMSADEIKKAFNHYINNILSILETLLPNTSFKSTRRLVLNEIHGCKSEIIKLIEIPVVTK